VLAKAPEQIGETFADLTSQAVQIPGEVLAGIARGLAKQVGLDLPVPLMHIGIVASLLLTAFLSWYMLRPKHVNLVG
jgi:hypothetical protein